MPLNKKKLPNEDSHLMYKHSSSLIAVSNQSTQRETWWKIAVIAGIIISSLTVIIVVDNMLSSFILAFAISYLSEPIISYFERKGIQRSLCISLYFTFSGLILAILMIWLAPLVTRQATLLQSELPKYVENITRFMITLENKFSGPLSSVYELRLSSNIGDFVQEWIEFFIGSVPAMAQSTVITLLLGPFFAFFILKDGHAIRRQFLSIVPNFLFEMVLNLTYNINKHIGGFIRARLLEGLIVGIVVWIGLTIIQFPYTAFLALFAGITNLIPYIGPIIGMVPAYVIALPEMNFITVVFITAVYVIAQLIDVFFIIPLVVARIVDLHPITVVVVIIIGSQVMGVLGMIISIPVTKCIKLTISTVYAHLIEIKPSY